MAKAILLVLIGAGIMTVIASRDIPGKPYIQHTTATSGTVNIADVRQDVCLVHEAGLTLTLTIAMPPNPTDGQRVILSSTGGITTLSMTASTGTIMNAAIAMGAGGNATWVYSKPQDKFYRMN